MRTASCALATRSLRVEEGEKWNVDLPALEECHMGRHAVEGDDTDKSSSVEMRGYGEQMN